MYPWREWCLEEEEEEEWRDDERGGASSSVHSNTRTHCAQWEFPFISATFHSRTAEMLIWRMWASHPLS